MRASRPDAKGIAPLLTGIALIGIVAGTAATALVLSSDADHRGVEEAVSTGVVGWFFVGSGLAGWLRRPDSRVGPLLTAAGFAWFAGGLDESQAPLVYAAGELSRPLFIPLSVHALLGLASGRLRPLDRGAVLALYGAVLVLGPARFMVSVKPNDDCSQCPPNPLALIDHRALLELLTAVQQAVVVAGVAVAALIVAARWRSASRAGARAVVPVLGAAGAAMVYLLALGGEQVIDPLNGVEPVLAVVEIAAASAIPVLLLVGLARSGSALEYAR